MTTVQLLKLKKLQKGFTLIELLIVIAVLGVLSTAVLVAINPAEQIARGKDAGRINTVDQVGHAVQAYYTAQQGFPVVGTWDTVLTTSGELKAFPSAPAGGTACTTNIKSGFCYSLIGTTDAVVFTQTESSSSKTKAGGCATQPWAVFYTASGKTGLVCATEANTILGGQTQF
jgi:prepilin-type N-terminal cleavage/methylation domain-containing protein